MIIFDEIMQRIKEVIATHTDKRRIYNKEVAQALELTPEYFAVIKKREKIPYEAIALFCKKQNISINWVLFGQEPQKLGQIKNN